MPSTEYTAAAPTDAKVIVCIYCDKPQEVGRKAKTVTCRFCYKGLNLEDLPIKQYEARRVIETCGLITVDKKGTIVAERVRCSGLVVKGKIKANVTSGGPVSIAATGEIKGDVTAPTITIGAGAVVEGRFAIGPTDGEARHGPEPRP